MSCPPGSRLNDTADAGKRRGDARRSTLDLPNIDPPTSFHFNGGYIAREGTSVAFSDVAQLELLPGPQGTLYGRSSLGGAVHVTLNGPTQSAQSSGLLEVGDPSLMRATVVRNLPLDERHARRGAPDWMQRDGHRASGADGVDGADAEWDHVDGKAGLEIDVGRDSLLSATARSGHQPGT